MRFLATLAAIFIAIPMMAQTETIQPLDPGAATVTRTFSLRSGGVLKIANRNGDVKVTAWDREEVELIARLKPNSKDEHVSIEVTSNSRSLDLIVKYPKNRKIVGRPASCEMELKVPRRIVGNISNRNSAISLHGISGDNRIGTRNGKISLDDVSGYLVVKTRNGGVHGDVLHLGRDVSISTRNGAIDIKLVDPDAKFNATSRNGAINLRTPGVKDFKAKAKSVSAVFADGRANISLVSRNGQIFVQ